MEHGHAIKTFDPLLRDLVGWGLVTRAKDGSGRWVIAEHAQRRLDELVHLVSPIDAHNIVYFNRKCALCHQQTPTRLRDDRYLCDPCNARQIAGSEDKGSLAS
ncbi:MAG: hypothetical protein WAM97_13780 [Acidimicrobiales bacterium]|jgi:hypothetical protein